MLTVHAVFCCFRDNKRTKKGRSSLIGFPGVVLSVRMRRCLGVLEYARLELASTFSIVPLRDWHCLKNQRTTRHLSECFMKLLRESLFLFSPTA